MRKIIVALAVTFVAGCGSGGSDSNSIVGNWLYESPDGTSGTGVEFRDDGTYTAYTLALTSTSSADAQVETGTYQSTATSITTVPAQWTCSGADPATTVTFSFQGGLLLVQDPDGELSLSRDSSTINSAFALTYGCFDTSASGFTAMPLAPVSN